MGTNSKKTTAHTLESHKVDIPSAQSSWTVYILRCSDTTLYTGITNNLAHRFQQHTLGKGARYTRGRQPLSLVYTEEYETKSEALKREYIIKQMPKERKVSLIESSIPKTHYLLNKAIQGDY